MLEVPDKDAARVLEFIRGIKRVKGKLPQKASLEVAADSPLVQDLREAGQELARLNRGEKVSYPARKLLAEVKDGL